MTDGVRIRPFDGLKDFAMWKVKMKALLVREKCYEAVSQEWPTGLDDAGKNKLSELAFSEIIIRLTDDVARQVYTCTSAKELWEKLDSIYLSKSLPNKISLLCKFFNFRLDTSLSLAENLDIYLKIQQDLKRCGDKVISENQTYQAVVFLNALPSQFETIKDVIQYSSEELTFDKVFEAVTMKNDTLKIFKTKSGPKTEPKGELMVFKGKNKNFHKQKNFQSNPNKPENNFRSNDKSKPPLKCNYCGKLGHTAQYCYKKRDDNQNKKGNQSNNKSGCSNVCEINPNYPNELLMVGNGSESDTWILDSGCTMHATPNKNVFSSLKLTDQGEVKLGDHSCLKIKGTGSVPIKMFDGVIRVLQNVKWVPNLRRNLLSESMFDKSGCEINTSKGIKEVIKNGKTVIKSKCHGGLYYLETVSEINITQNNDKQLIETKKWHERMGHIGNKGLHYMFTTGLIKDKPVDLSFCEVCVLGKKCAHPFNKSSFVAENPLEYVHADLWGPAQVQTIGGRKYFLSLVDHFSKKVWVNLLRSKDETFDSFKAWKVIVESQSGLKLKCLRTDNGLEFCNGAFNQYCAQEGIRRHLTVPATPQQNGTAERMNRTLLEKARCMLFRAGMKSSLWGEAVLTAAYLINRSPSSGIGFKTPQELWTGKKPNITHLRPFGCTAYAMINQGKLEPRAIKCVMLGYPEGVKGYKLLSIQPGGYKVLTARSVTFNEEDFYFKTRLTAESSSNAGTNADDLSFMQQGLAGEAQGHENDVDEQPVLRIPRRARAGNAAQAGDPARDTSQVTLTSYGPQVSVSNSSLLNSSSNLGLENLGNVNSDLLVDPADNIASVPASPVLNSQLHDSSLPVNSDSVDELSADGVNADAINSDELESVVNQENLQDYVLSRDRTPRVKKPNRKYDVNLTEMHVNLTEYALITADQLKYETPETVEQALTGKHCNEWKLAMTEEIQSMQVNQTWSLVPRPKNVKIIGSKWIFKVKEPNEPNEKPRFKARLVAKGYNQREGIDYTDIFAPVVKYKTMRLLIAMAAVHNWELDQMDVKTAFLHGNLNETIYMEQPKGFVDKYNPNYVCLLNKSIYGLKQSPRMWNKKFNSCMLSLGFVKSKYDSCLYMKNAKSDCVLFVLLYVDDILIISNLSTEIERIKSALSKHFDMKDLGQAQRILGVKIIRDRLRKTIFLSQADYVMKILEKFSMSSAKPTAVPLGGHFSLSQADCPKTELEKQQMSAVPFDVCVGSVMYLMLCTRPDLSFAISLLSRFMAFPGERHWCAMKYVLRYIAGTKQFGLCFGVTDFEHELCGFVDASYGSNKDNGKSITSYYFLWHGNCISWKTQQQSVVALSSTEAEFIAATEAAKEAIWLQGLVKEIEHKYVVPAIFIDSLSALHLCRDPVYHERSKHIDIRLHFVRDKVETGCLKFEKIAGSMNPADFGTKIVPTNKYVFCRDSLRIQELKDAQWFLTG